ncbi:hypothetical protein H0H93_008368 [Arthromyces matolae]|nr:hypothetical protein H0H93_008368 [Arthromyces matolae]
MEIEGTESAEFSLLSDEPTGAATIIENHDLSTAPLITREAYELGQYVSSNTQYGVLGRLISTQ